MVWRTFNFASGVLERDTVGAQWVAPLRRTNDKIKKVINMTHSQPRTSQSNSAIATSEIIVAKNVEKWYSNNFHVLKGVSLTVNKGEVVVLMGPSGSGKSTFIRTFNGLEPYQKGSIEVDGVKISHELKHIEAVRREVGMVFQQFNLFPHLTVLKNVTLAPIHLRGMTKAKAEEAAMQLLERVGIAHQAAKYPGQLSGGQQQRVAIARALSIRPQVLILDEPFGALDAITKEELQEELLKIWQDFQVTVLMITHDIDEALFLADRLVMMTNGPSAKIGEVLNIPFSRPRNRAQMLEDPEYYTLRNYALDFLFRRFAHDDD